MASGERRRYVRLPKQARISCQEVTYPLGQTPEVTVQLLDVSEGGCRIESPQPFEAGTPLQVALVLQGWHRHTTGFLKHDQSALSQPLTALGRVVRSQPLGETGVHELGIQFVDIWEDHWRAMRIYLEKERRKPDS